jgi:hypothetical protein
MARPPRGLIVDRRSRIRLGACSRLTRHLKRDETPMNIARHMIGFFQSRKLELATAESCTAGLIASLLADVPGRGQCLDVGFVRRAPVGRHIVY